MHRTILTLGGLLLTAGAAVAQPYQNPQSFPSYQYGPPAQFGQFGGGQYGAVNPNAFAPNFFNPAVQPLSPYLNLLRGGNLAANYFYGVRPGTIGLGGRGPGSSAPFMAMGGYRPQFFPQLAMAPDPLASAGPGQPDILPPAGHPVVFNNTLGFFPSSFGQAGGQRAGLSGLGATQPRK
jgi:hypothetical protein